MKAVFILALAACILSSHASNAAHSPDFASWASSLQECFSDPSAPSLDTVSHSCWSVKMERLLPLVVEESADFANAVKQLTSAAGYSAPKYAAGEKCSGPPGSYAVENRGCVDGYECTGSADWGKTCAKIGNGNGTLTGTPVTGTPVTGTPVTGTHVTGTPVAGTPGNEPPRPATTFAFGSTGCVEDGAYFCQCSRTCDNWNTNGGQPTC